TERVVSVHGRLEDGRKDRDGHFVRCAARVPPVANLQARFSAGLLRGVVRIAAGADAAVAEARDRLRAGDAACGTRMARRMGGCRRVAIELARARRGDRGYGDLSYGDDLRSRPLHRLVPRENAAD